MLYFNETIEIKSTFGIINQSIAINKKTTNKQIKTF